MNKYGKTLNLKNVKADIIDTDPFSSYFVVSELPNILTSGKNGFSINGSNLLKVGSEVYIEVLNVNGSNIYVEVAKNSSKVSYKEGSSIVYSIQIYADTPVGVGIIYLVGTDTYGKLVKWKKNIEINPSIQNKSKVRFYNKPSIQVTPFINVTSETDVIETNINGTFKGIPVKPMAGYPISYIDQGREEYEYIIDITSGGSLTSDMVGRTITLNGNDYIIQEVINSSKLKIAYPITKNGKISSDSGDLSIEYYPYNNPTTISSNAFKKIGTAEILFRNIETFTGKIYRYKIYRSSINAPYDSECISTGIFYATEHIYDSETPYRHQSVLGKILNSEFLDQHWFVSNPSTDLSHSPDKMIDSFETNGFENSTRKSDYIIVKSGVSGSVDYVPYDNVTYMDRSSDVYNSNFIRLYKNIEYIFSADVIKTSNTHDTSGIEFYLKSSFSNAMNNKICDSTGLKLFELSDNKTGTIYYGKVNGSFILEEDCYGTLVIYPYRSNYVLSNISIKPYTDYSYGPDIFSIRVPFDVRAKNEGNKITCELLDVDNKLVIGELSTIQYFDPYGVTYPFNVIKDNAELILDLADIEMEMGVLSGSLYSTSQSLISLSSEFYSTSESFESRFIQLSESVSRISGSTVSGSFAIATTTTLGSVSVGNGLKINVNGSLSLDYAAITWGGV
jgi:hypothetical protein